MYAAAGAAAVGLVLVALLPATPRRRFAAEPAVP
jgi:hypothetical protein